MNANNATISVPPAASDLVRSYYLAFKPICLLAVLKASNLWLHNKCQVTLAHFNINL